MKRKILLVGTGKNVKTGKEISFKIPDTLSGEGVEKLRRNVSINSLSVKEADPYTLIKCSVSLSKRKTNGPPQILTAAQEKEPSREDVLDTFTLFASNPGLRQTLITMLSTFTSLASDDQTQAARKTRGN